MSVQAITWAYARKEVTDPIEAFILVTLANYADDYGVAWPATRTLADECRCSRRKVQYALEALEARGLILGFERRRGNGTQRSNAFLLVGFEGRKRPMRPDEHPVLEALYLAGRLPADAIRVHVVHPAIRCDGCATGCTGCANRVHPVRKQGAPGAPLEPSYEPPKEPSPLPPAGGGDRKEPPHVEASANRARQRRQSSADIRGAGWAAAVAKHDPRPAGGAGSDQ